MAKNDTERINLCLPKALTKFVKEEAGRQNRSVNNLVFVVLLKFKEETEADAIICTSAR